MAVPQLQLANLGEIFAQNQARQANMDNVMLQQQAALEQRQAQQAAAQREAAIRQAIASGVDPSSREGLGQLLQAGLPLEQFQGGLKSIADRELAQARSQAAQAQGQSALMRGQAAQQTANTRAWQAQQQIALSRAQEARMLREFNRGRDKTEIEIAQKLSKGMLAIPEEQRPAAYLALKDQFGGLVPSLFEDEGYSPEMGVVMQALANSAESKAPSSTLGKLRADLQAGNITQEEFDAAQKKATTVSGEGSFKEYQYKAAQYGQRMNSASENMKSFENPSVLEKAFQKSGILGNFAQTPERQMYYQAQREFINAIKRQESGAAVTDSEVEDYAQTYFPQPGDTPEVMQRKRQARERAIAGNKATAGGAWEEVGKAVSAVTESQPTPSGGGQGGQKIVVDY